MANKDDLQQAIEEAEDGLLRQSEQMDESNSPTSAGSGESIESIHKSKLAEKVQRVSDREESPAATTASRRGLRTGIGSRGN